MTSPETTGDYIEANIKDLRRELFKTHYDDYMSDLNDMEFNIEELRREFKTHCVDYMSDLNSDVPSKAVEFCSKVIHKIGPELRKVKKGTGYKVWKFIFHVKDTRHYVIIDPNGRYNTEFVQGNETMILSLKQAELLAHETLDRLVVFGCTLNKILLTPLAAACFCKENLEKLQVELNIEKHRLITIINQSTQFGGHSLYLSHSDIDFAICAVYAVTQNVKDENRRNSIIVKIIKQYMAHGHIPDRERINIICKYVTGGIPADFSFENINKLLREDRDNNSY